MEQGVVRWRLQGGVVASGFVDERLAGGDLGVGQRRQDASSRDAADQGTCCRLSP